MLKIRRFPTIIGLLILLAGLGGGLFLVQKAQTFFLRAEPGSAPNQIRITNITDQSFTVSWTTDKKVAGLIQFGETSRLGSVLADDRDQQAGEISLFFTHYVTIKNLKAETDYYFKIRSGSKIYDQNGQPYQTTTAPTISFSSPPNDPAYGKVIDQSGQSAQGAIVYLSLANTTPQSALVQESGNWVISLNSARSVDLSSYATYDKAASIEEILVQAEQGLTATAVTTTKNDSPVPTITLGQNYNFRQTSEELEITDQEKKVTQEATQEASPTPTPTSGFSVESPEATTSQELAIINPDEEEDVNTQKPAILGTGPAGITLEITIESTSTYTGTVTIDDQGNWEWSPPVDLEPGEHTVTATFTDEEGKKHTVSHTFVVLAAGKDEAPAIEATPSAEASPSPTLTPTPIPATRTAIPSTEGGVPDSGYLTPTFLVFIMGLGLILIGFVIKKFAAHG